MDEAAKERKLLRIHHSRAAADQNEAAHHVDSRESLPQWAEETIEQLGFSVNTTIAEGKRWKAYDSSRDGDACEALIAQLGSDGSGHFDDEHAIWIAVGFDEYDEGRTGAVIVPDLLFEQSKILCVTTRSGVVDSQLTGVCNELNETSANAHKSATHEKSLPFCSRGPSCA